MIVDGNITTYVHSLEPDGPAWLEKIRDDAELMGVPIIRREMEPFLKVLLNISQPGKILEIGTGIGYSALFMHSVLPDAWITTMENYEPRLVECRKRLAGEDHIRLQEGDAVKLIREREEPADFIFLDGPKAQYLRMLPDILRLLPPGGILLADNILQGGELVRSRYVIPRRQRTIHSRMRDFLWEVKHCPQLKSSVITLGDGVVLSVKQ